MYEDMSEQFTSPVYDLEAVKRAMDDPMGRQVVIEGAAAGNTAEEDKASGVKAALFIIAFIGGMISAVVFSQPEPLLCMTSAGAIFLVIGLINLFQSKLSLDNAAALILPFVGLLMTGLPIVMLYGRRHPESFQLDRNMVIKLILICMGVLGIFLAVLPPVAHKRRLARCSQRVQAKCIYRVLRTKHSEKAGGRTRVSALYSPVWQYVVGDVVFVTRENVFSDFDTPAAGDFREIRYDPKMPAYIYRPMKGTRGVPMFIGLAFAVLSAVALIVMK
ncbi:hypothetical protein [Ruminococcus sp.]|uniref:hypothetical protein n=1 Tax=Ruminococcus sp. TaxID=41978 RepID=UPI0025E1F18E|nr:hypothetical protein [Ruminococcus sp.]MBQ8965659.1 hypothetical protein [Ruminococcus sp.]